MSLTSPMPPHSRLTDADVFLTRAEAARYLRRSIVTMEKWAQIGRGPTFKRVGGKVLYPLTGLRRFVEEA